MKLKRIFQLAMVILISMVVVCLLLVFTPEQHKSVVKIVSTISFFVSGILLTKLLITPNHSESYRIKALIFTMILSAGTLIFSASF